MSRALPFPADLETRFDRADETPNTDRCGPVVTCLSGVRPRPLTWLWRGRVPLGKLTMIVGDPDLGKSLVTLDMASRVSTGTPWADARETANPVGSVIIISCEDDIEDTIVPRLLAAGADLDRIHCLEGTRNAEGRIMPFSLEDVAVLESAIERVGDVRLVVIDPISAYLGRKADGHSNTDVRGLLGPLAELAQRHRCAVVAVSHLRKGEGKAMYRAMGSLAFVAAARSVLAVAKAKGAPNRRLVLPVKGNLGPPAPGLCYEVAGTPVMGLGDQPVLRWIDVPVEETADDVLGPQRPGPEAESQNEAATWLREALADGPRLACDLYDEGVNGKGLSKRTIVRARETAGIIAFRPENPGPWWWKLEAQCHDTPRREPGYLGIVPGSGQKQGFSGGDEGPKKHNAKLPGVALCHVEPPRDPCPGFTEPPTDRATSGVPNEQNTRPGGTPTSRKEADLLHDEIAADLRRIEANLKARPAPTATLEEANAAAQLAGQLDRESYL